MSDEAQECLEEKVKSRYYSVSQLVVVVVWVHTLDHDFKKLQELHTHTHIDQPHPQELDETDKQRTK